MTHSPHHTLPAHLAGRNTRLSNEPSVAIILLNYGGASDTGECLRSLKHLQYGNARIFVVDNASPDNSADTLRSFQAEPDRYPAFELIVSEKNLGYSGGNNLAIRRVLAHNQAIEDRIEETPSEREALEAEKIDYVWLLNNDTTVDPRALTHLVDEARQTGGLVGSLLLYPDRRYQQVGTQINWHTGGTRGYPEGALRDQMAVECLTGASLLVPSAVFRRIGPLDESYFLYFEDAEFCLRAAAKHIPKTLALQSRVYHHEGKTTGKHSLRTQYYFHRNRLRLLRQYASAGEKFTIYPYAAFRLFRSCLKALLNGSAEKRASLAVQWLAVQDFYRGVSGPCPHPLNTP